MYLSNINDNKGVKRNCKIINPLSSLLENQVAVQLTRLYGEGVYFYHHNIEVDFYIPEAQLVILLFGN